MRNNLYLKPRTRYVGKRVKKPSPVQRISHPAAFIVIALTLLICSLPVMTVLSGETTSAYDGAGDTAQNGAAEMRTYETQQTFTALSFTHKDLIASAPDLADTESEIDTAENEKPYTEDDIELIAKTMSGEALITHSDMEMAGVAWCILNRVDDGQFPDTIKEVVTAKKQFHGYREDNQFDEHTLWLAEDVLERWTAEKNGEADCGRVLPAEYLYFYGDGSHNYFTTEYHEGDTWDWSLTNPYES